MPPLLFQEFVVLTEVHKSSTNSSMNITTDRTVAPKQSFGRFGMSIRGARGETGYCPHAIAGSENVLMWMYRGQGYPLWARLYFILCIQVCVASFPSSPS